MSPALDLAERLALCEAGQADRALQADAAERARNEARLWNSPSRADGPPDDDTRPSTAIVLQA